MIPSLNVYVIRIDYNLFVINFGRKRKRLNFSVYTRYGYSKISRRKFTRIMRAPIAVNENNLSENFWTLCQKSATQFLSGFHSISQRKH